MINTPSLPHSRASTILADFSRVVRAARGKTYRILASIVSHTTGCCSRCIDCDYHAATVVEPSSPCEVSPPPDASYDRRLEIIVDSPVRSGDKDTYENSTRELWTNYCVSSQVCTMRTPHTTPRTFTELEVICEDFVHISLP